LPKPLEHRSLLRPGRAHSGSGVQSAKVSFGEFSP
jgi:hypothetical protein